MTDTATLQQFLAGATIAPTIHDLRPDYRVMLVAASGIAPGPSDETSEALLKSAEATAANLLRDQPVDQLPHIASWREAYRAFGAKPQRTRNSLEALTRRASGGLPRINRLTDIYNAVSVQHQLPLGGEDLNRYDGPPRLIRATGTEDFDTVADGQPAIEHPDPGEVVWCDDSAVTCRRWNWRQGRRTQLTGATASALFILDALDPMGDDALLAATDELSTHLAHLGPNVRIAHRLLRSSATGGKETM